MKIELQQIPIRDLVDGYENNEEEGVVGYGGRLDIRPKYQREFVYKDDQKKAVINTVMRGYPLNVMYWVRRETGDYELLDGQQRTLSICSYFNGEYSVDIDGSPRGYNNLTADQRSRFLDYPIMVYICSEGTESERIEWFKTINIAGERLTDQEILNAVYAGTWLTAAKRKFSRTACVAVKKGDGYIKGNPIRQDILETSLTWISGSKKSIAQYMSLHQHDTTADAEWQYFQQVINWAQMLFPKKRKEMRSVEWGLLYNRCNDNTYSATALEEDVQRLYLDEEVTSKTGIYPYLLTSDESYLSLRTFPDKIKGQVYEQQGGICPLCGQKFEINDMEADHIAPWSEGGTTTIDNCQMLCRSCNRRKSNK